jgi:hypothetical protein
VTYLIHDVSEEEDEEQQTCEMEEERNQLEADTLKDKRLNKKLMERDLSCHKSGLFFLFLKLPIEFAPPALQSCPLYQSEICQVRSVRKD